MSAHLERLADLLVRYDDARQAGRPLSPQQLCAETPDLLEPFTALLRKLRRVDAVFDGSAAVPADQLEVIDAGRFQPLAFHGEGGLGVVFRAEDVELKRAVALKWMKPLPSLDPVARRRFVREAEITGKLEHPGVAPVYGAGHDPHGRPYYAMRFIEGPTLADEIEALHADPRPHRAAAFPRLLRAFASVCQTVAYAHARGVIHRDLKPDNVVLGPYRETLVVDWGLAKRIDLPDPDGTVDIGYAPVKLELAGGRDTVYGQVKGTPAFMPPEQAHGDPDRIGMPADVYALGATLYVLLAGRSPYEGTAASVIEQVKHGPPPPPRAVLRAVPKPLDAICRKAMSREPNDRYAGPQHLADDIERWLADAPASAYRDPIFTRLRRWSQRHRTGVATALAALLVVAAALAAVVPLLASKNRELTDRKTDLEKTNGELEAANAARRIDFEESDGVLRGVMENVFARATFAADARTNALREDAVRQYLAYQERFIRRNADRTEMRLEVALAWSKVGEANALAGRAAEAVAGFAEAEAKFRALVAEQPADRDFRFGLAAALAGRGMYLSERGDVTAAFAALRECRDTFEQLAADPTPIRLTRFNTDADGLVPDSPALRLLGVTTELVDLSRAMESGAGLPTDDTRRQWISAALSAATGGKPLPDTAPPAVHFSVLALKLRGTDLAASPADARKELATVLADADAVLARFPNFTELQLVAVDAALGLGRLAKASGDTAATRAAFEDAQARINRVKNRDFALDPFGFRAHLLVAELEVADELSSLAAARRDTAAVLAQSRIAVQTLDQFPQLRRLTPATTARGVARCIRMAQMAGRAGPNEAMEKCYQGAVALLAAQAATATDPQWARLKVTCETELLSVQARLGRPVEAAVAEAGERLAALLRAAPNDVTLRLAEPQLPIAVAQMWLARADAAVFAPERLRALANARAAYRRAAEIADASIGVPAFHRAHARARVALMLVEVTGKEAAVRWVQGWFLRTRADEAEARRLARRAAAELDAITTPVAPPNADPVERQMVLGLTTEAAKLAQWITVLRRMFGDRD